MSTEPKSAVCGLRSEVLPKHRFTHLGRAITLYKRTAKDGTPWYLTFQHAGQLHKNLSLGTPDLAGPCGAKAKAKLAIEAALNNTWHTYLAALRGEPAAGPACTVTIGRLLQTYEYTRIPDGASDATRHHNANSLRNFLRRALAPSLNSQLSTLNPDALSLSVLTESTVMAFASQTAGLCAQLNQVDAASAKRTANSIMVHVGSILHPRVLKYLASAAAQPKPLADLPDFTAFRLALEEHAFQRVPRASHAPPEDQVILATLAAWAGLPRNEYLVVGHILSCGLRKAEISQARWDWHTERHGAPFLRGTITDTADLEVKNQSGRVEVQPLDPFWRQMQDRIRAEHWQSTLNSQLSTDYILTSSARDRTDDVFRRVSQWLRSLGWTGQKTNHALRAWAGQQVALAYEIYTASLWLRHTGVKVTEQHYVHLKAPGSPQQPLVQVTWARHPEAQTFTPSIVQAAPTPAPTS